MTNRLAPRIPGSIVALCLGTAAVAVFHLDVDTIGTAFGGIPAGLPAMHMPRFRLDLIGGLMMPAMTVALLGAIESLMSAMVADRMSGDHHDSNVELVAQGLANIASPLFGGLPATGAIARTATNIRSGAKSPIAGIVHALTLLLILVVAAPLARHIPLAVLAAILMVVAYNMGDWSEIPELLRLTKTDITVWIATFALTVFTDLTTAVGVGMALADPPVHPSRRRYHDGDGGHRRLRARGPAAHPSGQDHSVVCAASSASTVPSCSEPPISFGRRGQIDALPAVVILRLRNMTALDATGLHAFEELAEAMRAPDDI